MTLERRLSKLEASIWPEVRPPKVAVIGGYRDGEDKDAAQERHFAAHPEDRGATLVVFLRKIFKGDDAGVSDKGSFRYSMGVAIAPPRRSRVRCLPSHPSRNGKKPSPDAGLGDGFSLQHSVRTRTGPIVLPFG